MSGAMRTCPAREAKPRHPDLFAQFQAFDTRAKRIDTPDDLVRRSAEGWDGTARHRGYANQCDRHRRPQH